MSGGVPKLKGDGFFPNLDDSNGKVEANGAAKVGGENPLGEATDNRRLANPAVVKEHHLRAFDSEEEHAVDQMESL